MVERSLSMREVPGSIPGASRTFFSSPFPRKCQTKIASSGNRTRAARVAGEHSTTEPTMPHENVVIFGHYYKLAKKQTDRKKYSQSVGFEPTLPEGN